MENTKFDIAVLDNGVMEFLVSKISNYVKVKSAFVVGSMSNLNYELKTNNDYDVRLLVDSVSEKLLDDINSGLSLLQSYLSNKFPVIIFTYSCLIGPVRHISTDGAKSILLHCIVMQDRDFYSLPIMHRVSYTNNYRLISGDDFLSQNKLLKLSLAGIIKDSEGIEYCIEHIAAQKITYLDWKTINGKSKLVKITMPFTLQSGFEFLNYSIKYCTQNLLAYLKQEHLCGLLQELRIIEKEKAPVFQYVNYIENKDIYIEQSLDYLRDLLLFAKNANRNEA